MDNKSYGQCALCASPKKQCGGGDFIPDGICSTELYPEVIEKAVSKYAEPEFAEFAKQAGRQTDSANGTRGGNGVSFPTKSRIQETVEFMKRMGYKKIGLAYCGSVQSEAANLCKIFQANGFEVVSVCCKVGKMGRDAIGIGEEEIKRHHLPNHYQCNPIAQAEILNYEKTEFNVMLGLCVGHDSMFLKNAEAMTTVLASKDRLLCNNAMAPLYQMGMTYRRLLNPEAYDEFDRETGDLISKEQGDKK